MHVDAASGGFLAPFCAPDVVWDFRLPRVKSISTSAHKYGLAPLGCGWIIWRDADALAERLVFDVDYLGGSVGTIAINFSRPAGQVIAQILRFHPSRPRGLREDAACPPITSRPISPRRSRSSGPFEFFCNGDPKTGIPAV